MRKSSRLGVALLIILTLAFLLFDWVRPYPAKERLYRQAADWISECALLDRSLDENLAATHRFAGVAALLEQDLFAGRLSLVDTVERIHEAAKTHFPEFLNMIARVEAGATIEEQIARNLIRHIQVEVEENSDVVRRLQGELAMMLKKRPRNVLPGLIVSMA